MNEKHYPRIPMCVSNPSYDAVVSVSIDNLLAMPQTSGIASTSYLKGQLFELRERMKHEVVFFERIKESPVPTPIDEGREEHHWVGYRKQENQEYRFFFAGIHSSVADLGNCNRCVSQRKSDPTFSEGCICRDLENVHKAFTAFDYNETGFFKPFPASCGRSDFDYHIYCCQEKGFTEIVVPVYTSPTKKFVMGMLVFGQLIIDEEMGSLQKPWLDTQELSDEERKNQLDGLVNETKTDEENGRKRWFETTEAVFCHHKEAIGDFIDRMQERVRLCKTDYLFALQDYLFEEHENSAADDVEQALYDIFHDIAGRFSLRQCLFFLPDLTDAGYGEDREYVAVNALADTPTRTNVKIDVNRSFPEIQSRKVAIDILRESGCIRGFDFAATDNRFLSYYGSKDDQHFFGILLAWDPEWYDQNATDNDDYPHDSFFASLVSLCRVKIISRVAKLRQDKIRTFSDITVHDLAQKAHIMDLHNGSFEMDLKDAETDGVFGNSQSWRDMDRNDPKRIFIQRCVTYNRQMIRCQQSLEFLRRTLDLSNLRTIPIPRSFNPFNTFIANFNQHFNNPYYVYKSGKRLNIQHPEVFRSMFADSVMIERSLNNLLDNAFKFAHDGTHVYLEYEFSDGCHVYTVTNYGCGIPIGLKNEIFKPRIRGNIGQRGQGLGLSIADEFVKKNHGVLEIASGICETDASVSPYHLGVMEWIRRHPAYYGHDKDENKKIGELLNTERKRLEETESKNSIANDLGRRNIYSEIFVRNDREQDGGGSEMTHFLIRQIYNVPTYAVSFRIRIPQNPKFNTEV